MGYKNLLIHTCDLYKKGVSKTQSEYGAPIRQEEVYPTKPTQTGIKCFFASKQNSLQVESPGVKRKQRYLVHFLPNVEVALGDRIVRNGITYQLEEPVNIRNHHIEVEVERVYV